MSGMSEQQIEAMLAKQSAAIKDTDTENMHGQVEAFADAMGSMNIGDMFGKSESLFEFAENPSINESYRWAVACGADLAHKRSDIVNDLSTGTDRTTCLELLLKEWGIRRKQDFSAMAESLKEGRDSLLYAGLAAGNYTDGFSAEKKNFEKAKTLFLRDGLLDDGVPNMRAWDLGRLVNVSRLAFDAGIITRQEALKYLREAALLAKKEYTSWKDLSIGFQFARAVRGGPDGYDEFKEGMEELLTEEDSPWVTLPFELALSFED